MGYTSVVLSFRLSCSCTAAVGALLVCLLRITWRFPLIPVGARLPAIGPVRLEQWCRLTHCNRGQARSYRIKIQSRAPREQRTIYIYCVEVGRLTQTGDRLLPLPVM